MKQKLSACIKRNRDTTQPFITIGNHLPGYNRLRIGRRNSLHMPNSILRHTRVTIRGSENVVVLGDHSALVNCRITIAGSGNRIDVGANVTLIDTELHIEDDGNVITIGDNNAIAGTTHLAAIERTSITIGADCLFSREIRFATGDSHSLVDRSGRRLNP